MPLKFTSNGNAETPAHSDFLWPGDFAISFWFKFINPTLATRPVAVAFPTQPNANKNGGMWISAHGGATAANDNKLHCVARPTTATEGFLELVSNDTLNDDTYHLGVFQRNSNALELWVDAVLDDTNSGATGATGNIGFSSEEFGVGDWDIIHGWKGSLDEFAVWKGVCLTADQIAQLYGDGRSYRGSPLGIAYNNLVLYWDLVGPDGVDADGDKIIDLSGKGKEGTILSAEWESSEVLVDPPVPIFPMAHAVSTPAPGVSLPIFQQKGVHSTMFGGQVVQ